eukprot:8728059-Pyramimonas_sp.AAC.1
MSQLARAPRGAPDLSTSGAMRGGEKTSMKETLERPLDGKLSGPPSSERFGLSREALSISAFRTRELHDASWSSFHKSPSSHSCSIGSLEPREKDEEEEGGWLLPALEALPEAAQPQKCLVSPSDGALAPRRDSRGDVSSRDVTARDFPRRSRSPNWHLPRLLEWSRASDWP